MAHLPGDQRCGNCSHFEELRGAILGTCWLNPPAPVKSDKGEVLWLHCRVSPGDGCSHWNAINHIERERLALEAKIAAEKVALEPSEP